MTSFLSENGAFENWMRTACDVVEEDLARKHERMKKSSFLFLRATFFRWAHLVKSRAPEILDLPSPLSVGDTHVENFGTWRDAEMRLVWGVNDHDDAALIPYASDLVRLTASVRLAEFDLSNREAAAAILGGYETGLRAAGPTLLDERERWLRDYVGVSDEERASFWEEIDGCPAAEPPEEAQSALLGGLPRGAKPERFARRTKGGGSLGRPRFVLVANWRGGRIVREAKAILTSGWDWANGRTNAPNYLEEIVNASTRAPDPFLTFGHGFLVRRLSADTRKVERDADFDAKLDAKLLRAMGSEIGSIHAHSFELRDEILADLDGRDAEWLHELGKLLSEGVEADFEEWKAFQG
ncbi:DUF2252 family protein [Bradyrhizobium yuanmingense]|uniref:DUF2252 family protein n=1 Tax=Bradyrhizobium yuanmingense TaxID=108015 RepID=UPI00056BFFD7|nr:DUF2252 family protein [Bradyrhizobium yuanmingense]